MASIQKRRNSAGETWRVSFRIDGRLTSDTFTNAKAAGEYKVIVERIGGNAARAVLEARRNKTPGTILVSNLFADYLAQLTGITPGTRSEYQRMAARSWLPLLGDLPAVSLRREHITTWLNGEDAQKLAGKTLRNQFSLLSSLMKFAIVEKALRVDNPCQGIRLPRTVPAESVYLSEQEFANLYAVIPDRWKLLVGMLAGTGCRWGEATALRWNDLDLDAAVPVVHISRAQKHGVEGNDRIEATTKTKRSMRTVSLPSQLTEQLRAARAPGNGYIFAEDDGSAVGHHRFYMKVWTPAVKEADLGKRPTIHSLRHSSASWLIAAGLPLPVIQRRLGHEQISTTIDRYGHLAPGALSEAADAASNALSRAMPITVMSEIES